MFNVCGQREGSNFANFMLTFFVDIDRGRRRLRSPALWWDDAQRNRRATSALFSSANNQRYTVAVAQLRRLNTAVIASLTRLMSCAICKWKACIAPSQTMNTRTVHAGAALP